MERITFRCSQCGAELSAPVAYAGKRGKCKACGYSITAPRKEPAEVPAPLADLIRMLQSASLSEVCAAAQRVGEYGESASVAIPILVDRAREFAPNHPLSSGWPLLVKALGKLGQPALPALVSLLQGKESLHTRSEAGRTLAEIGEPAVPALIECIEGPDAWGKERAAWALGLTGRRARAAVPALTRLLSSSSPDEVERAAESLGKIGKAAATAAPELIKVLGFQFPEATGTEHQVQRAAISALTAIGGAALPALTECLARTDNPTVRENIARTLGSMGKDGATASAALAALLDDPSPMVRIEAAAALWRAGERTRAEPVLRELAEHESADVRYLAAAAFHHVGEAEFAASVLADLLGQSDEFERYRAALSLGDIGASAAAVVPALVRLLDDPARNVRGMAARALGRIGAPARPAVSKLQAMLRTDPDMKAQILLSLDQIG